MAGDTFDNGPGRQKERNEPPLISQEELDAAMQEARKARQKARAAKAAAEADTGDAPTPVPPAESAPLPDTVPFDNAPDLGLITQDELDQAVAEHKKKSGARKEASVDMEAPGTVPVPSEGEPPKATATPTTSAPNAAEEMAEQDEIDQLLRAVQKPRETQTSVPGIPPASTKEIERLLSDVQEPPAQRPDGEPDAGDALDTLLKSPDPAPPHHEADEIGPIGQDEIDQLLRAAEEAAALDLNKGKRKPPSRPDDAERSAVEEQPPPRKPEKTDGDPVPPAESTIPAEAQSASMDAQEEPLASHLDQSEIDDLTNTVPSSAEPEAPDGLLDQSDIDALLNSVTFRHGPESPEVPVETSPSPTAEAAPTQETAGADSNAPGDVPPEEDASETQSMTLSQEDLDAMLASVSSEELLDGQDLDAPVTKQQEDAAQDMEQLLGEVAQGDETSADIDQPLADAPPPPPAEVPEEEITPVEAAAQRVDQSQVGLENLAAAVPQSDDVLESILAEANAAAKASAGGEPERDDAGIPSPDELGAEIGPGKKRPVTSHRDDMVVQLAEEDLSDLEDHNKPLELQQVAARGGTSGRGGDPGKGHHLLEVAGTFARGSTLKAWASLAAAIICAAGTFVVLHHFRERMPDGGFLSAPPGYDIQEAVRSAKAMIDLGKDDDAIEVLKPVVESGEGGAGLAEAQYLYIKARYNKLPMHISEQEAAPLQKDIDDFVAMAPAFARNPELLRWKGDLYERSGGDVAALSTYENLLDRYAQAADADETMIRAARLAGRMHRPEDAQELLLRLLRQYPASAYAPEAKLLLGDAQLASGHPDEARRLFTQVALSEVSSGLGAEAVARLGQLDLDQHQYTQAIHDLENRLETATTVEGNEAVYLLLAKAYRANKDLDKAQQVLRELIHFFPESDKTPEAFIELSQVLDEAGNRREALKLAMQASQRFPDRPDVLINEGELRQRSGDDSGAAQSFASAVDAGGKDPQTLLAAGMAFEKVNELAKAHDMFEKLLTQFPSSPEAFEGNIALARTLEKQGQASAALDRLNNLADALAGKPQEAAIREALGDLYRDLGFTKQAASSFEDLAALTNDPEKLAKAATTLFDANEAGPALAIAKRVDVNALKPPEAYAFLTGYGKALLRMDSTMALEKMEQAYTSYPDQRTEQGDRQLLGAYMVMGQTVQARALVMDLDTYTRTHPGELPRLQRTAIQWGDALFDRGDFAGAETAYALADKAVPDSPDASWARFQQANTLLKQDQYAKGIELLDQVAASGASFAEDARLKAQYARLEQRLRKDVPAAAAQQGG